MGLIEYKKKRTFVNTPEPTGGKPSAKALSFVIQKHDASRLHYDLRLELDGVLKSWAVPKGPSLNPKDKRLAMLVEDHPFDYRTFEGVIPEGNYGAGTVIVWDEGTYEPLTPATSKKQQEKLLAEQFDAGSMKFRLHGSKLSGEFALVKMKGRDANAWLLIKHRDASACEEDITLKDRSIISGKTIEEIAGDPKSKQWQSNRQSSQTSKSTKKIKRSARRVVPVSNVNSDSNADKILAGISQKKKSPIPSDVKPMLATLVTEPVDKGEWFYEVKWDGFRALSYTSQRNVDIRSRNNKDFNSKFYPIHEALKNWGIDAVVDGEIVVVNAHGVPDFNALQEWRSEADGQLVYYLFDLLWYNGYSLMDVPLKYRKELLKAIIPSSGAIRESETFDINGHEFFRIADEMGLEGIVAKSAESIYTPDVRSKAWLKIKTERHQEAVIAGYTKNEGSDKPFSALLLGVYEDDRLIFIGPVGTGFTRDTQVTLLEQMQTLQTKTCPFSEVPDYNKPSRFRPNPPKAEVTWLKPKLVAEIAYRAIGADGGLRHPSFRGLREDKAPKSVTRELPLDPKGIASKEPNVVHERLLTSVEPIERKTLLNPKDETQVRNINGHDLKFPNLSKIFWPDEQITKRDMLNYYYQVAPYILPHLMDRPQTLNRFPNGIQGKSFYQKDVTGKVPAWISTYKYFSEGDQREKHFMVCTDEASLLYMAALACIEINPWSSRTQTPDHPDWCVIDLDPGETTKFKHVIEAACVTKSVLDTLELPSYCKTSGSTGLHIYIPLGAKYTYEESKEFARALVKIVHSQLPKTTSIERKVSDREGKMYLDFLQNRPQATLAGVYSLRPKPHAPVSIPLHWDEVKSGLSITDFTIFNAMDRIKETGDLFAPVLAEGIEMQQARSIMTQTFNQMGI